MAKGHDLGEEPSQNLFDVAADGGAGIQYADWAGDEVGDAGEDAGISVGANLVQTGLEERQSTTDENLSARERWTSTGGCRHHVPLDVGVADDAECPELGHVEKFS